MERRSIKKKPSQSHIVWTPDPDRDLKRFDERHLRKWCKHFDFDFEKYTRVDHDRSDESRTQYQCVFTYESGKKKVEIGGKQMVIQSDEIPNTFIELDDQGVIRIESWSSTKILDVTEFWHKGRYLFIRAKEREKGLKLDVKNLIKR